MDGARAPLCGLRRAVDLLRRRLRSWGRSLYGVQRVLPEVPTPLRVARGLPAEDRAYLQRRAAETCLLPRGRFTVPDDVMILLSKHVAMAQDHLSWMASRLIELGVVDEKAGRLGMAAYVHVMAVDRVMVACVEESDRPAFGLYRRDH